MSKARNLSNTIRINSSVTLPSGDTASRPANPAIGTTRFNTDFDALENYTALGWTKVSIPIPTITSITGTIYAGAASTLTFAGSRFGTTQGVVTFTSGATVANVNVTPSSDSALSVTVPAAIYGLSGGASVDIKFTNADNGVSNIITKTVQALPTGGTITTTGSYRVHTFTSSSSFVVPSGLSLSNVEYLVIAGGGSGGNTENYSGTGCGGGGAGGYRSSVTGESSGGGASAETKLSLSSGSYTVTVGAGAASQTSHDSGYNGSNSVFSTITSIGGGAGGGPQTNAGSGGSGGGSGYAASAGSGTSGQGYAGGQHQDPHGAGGGGAGAIGNNGDIPNNKGGNGGVGVQSSINGTATYRAGGGGGAGGSGASSRSSGGTGGGGYGTAGNENTGGNGVANTGGGGGGTGPADNGTSGAGGSGIVIVRYQLS